jgi:glycerol-3-phosphate dehydrogenase (NAD(P)+)
MRLTILAAGACGTALAAALSPGHQVTLWTRDAAALREMQKTRENRRFLPGIPLPAGLCFEADFHAAVENAGLIIAATPLAGLRAALRQLREAAVSAPLLWVCKGFEPGSGKLPHQVADEELEEAIERGVLTGPSFAEEVARGLPVALTLAARDAGFARRVAAELHGGRLRIYANDDLVGAEIGGAVKNVMAIAAGISDGLGFGHNARAALVTRGLAEIARLGIALGGQPGTFMGLAGMGDLFLTCSGDLSRNRRVGLALAGGKPLPQILAELGHVAEGVGTAREVAALARRLAIDMPITLTVDAILHHGESALDAVEKLLARDPKVENSWCSVHCR